MSTALASGLAGCSLVGADPFLLDDDGVPRQYVELGELSEAGLDVPCGDDVLDIAGLETVPVEGSEGTLELVVAEGVALCVAAVSGGSEPLPSYEVVEEEGLEGDSAVVQEAKDSDDDATGGSATAFTRINDASDGPAGGQGGGPPRIGIEDPTPQPGNE